MLADDTPPPDDRAMRARLDALSGALEAKRNERETRAGRNAADDIAGAGVGKAMSLGFRVMSEFIAGILVGGLIGWQLDRWLGWSPWGLIVFTMAGTAAGFWNVYRIAARPTGRPGGGA